MIWNYWPSCPRSLPGLSCRRMSSRLEHVRDEPTVAAQIKRVELCAQACTSASEASAWATAAASVGRKSSSSSSSSSYCSVPPHPLLARLSLPPLPPTCTRRRRRYGCRRRRRPRRRSQRRQREVLLRRDELEQHGRSWRRLLLRPATRLPRGPWPRASLPPRRRPRATTTTTTTTSSSSSSAPPPPVTAAVNRSEHRSRALQLPAPVGLLHQAQVLVQWPAASRREARATRQSRLIDEYAPPRPRGDVDCGARVHHTRAYIIHVVVDG